MATSSGSGSAAPNSTSSSSSTTTSTSTSTSSNPSETHHLLWSRSRVHVHPTPYSRDNIPGYLALVRKGPPVPRATILLSYLPQALLQERDEVEKFVKVEKRRCDKGKQKQRRGEVNQLEIEEVVGEDRLVDEDVQVTAVEVIDPETLLTNPSDSSFSTNSSRSTSTSPTSYAFSIPLSQLHSLRVCPPSILGVGSWHGTVNLNTINGVSLPTLYFHDDDSSSMRESLVESSITNDNVNGVSTTSIGSSATTSYPPPLPPRPENRSPTWGGDELLRETRKFSNVLRSVLDSKLFLVDPNREDYEAHSTPLFDDDAIDSTLPNKPKSNPNCTTSPNPNHSQFSTNLYPDDPYSFSKTTNQHSHPEAQMDPFTIWAKSTKMSVLTQFSQITQHARKASSNLLSHPLVRPHLIPGPVQSFAQAGPEPLGGPSDSEWKEISAKSGLEYDSARVYLAKWSRLVAEEGERNRRREEALLTGGGKGGDALGMMGKGDEKGELGIFEVLSSSSWTNSFSLEKIKSSRISGSEISLPEWNLFFDSENGKPLLSLKEMKSRIFSRGLDLKVRKFAWPFLLGFLPFESTFQERERFLERKKEEFERLKEDWKSKEEKLLQQDEGFKEQKHRVKVDCLRTDRGQEMFKNMEITDLEREEWRNRIRKDDEEDDDDDGPRPKINPNVLKLEEILLTYGFWDQAATKPNQQSSTSTSNSMEVDPDSNTVSDDEKKSSSDVETKDSPTLPSLDGYVQGMSDLCSPLFVVFDGDESLTFWCFASMMSRMRSNFLADQSGMKKQLLELQSLIRTFDPKLYSHLERADALNLFFCFRWLLICFKREFPFNDVLKLWECVWACEPEPEIQTTNELNSSISTSTISSITSSTSSPSGLTSQFQLFIALSILETHRDQVIRYLENFDEILQYYNGLAHNMDLEEVIEKAEISVKALRKLIERQQDSDEKKNEISFEIPEELKRLVG